MTPTVNLPEYEAQWFVDREQELDRVLSKVAAILAGDLLDKRTLIFTGEHGLGKSWLLRHQYHCVCQNPSVKSYYLNLALYTAERPPAEALQAICQQLIRHLLGESALPNATFEEQARYLIREIKQRVLSQHPIVVLFIDSVYESGPQLLQAFEEHILAPLAVETRLLLIMAGRGVEYPWRQAELRLHAEFITLEPFNADWTRAQISRQLPESTVNAQATHQLTLGNPKANWLLARHNNSPLAFDQLINEMLVPISQNSRAMVRTYLEALAVPRAFDRDNAPLLLNAYHADQRYLQLTSQEFRTLRDLLLEPGLIAWSTDLGGYALSPSTRNLILQFIRASDQARWIRLHQAVIQLYETWLREFPQLSIRWQIEIDYLRHQMEHNVQT